MNCDNLIISHWNANGIANHRRELQQFLTANNIDIMLISETHLTSKSCFRLPGYTCYNSNHPQDKPCGGTAILIRNRIRHNPLPISQSRKIQYTAINVTISNRNVSLVSVYCPPKYTIKSTEFESFFSKFHPRFLIAGDFNAKSPCWGSRLTSPKGRQLLLAINKQNLHCGSGGKPTYWPSDRRKIPDVIDLHITKLIQPDQITATTTLDLSSDHSPTILKLNLSISYKNSRKSPKTNWTHFQQIFKTKYSPNIRLKTEEDIDNGLAHLEETIAECIQQASADKPTSYSPPKSPTQNPTITQLVSIKRRAKKQWQLRRSPATRAAYTHATNNLKKELTRIENESFQEFTRQLSHLPGYSSVYKLTRKAKKSTTILSPIRNQQGTWLKDDHSTAEEFANHLEKTFSPNTEITAPNPPQGPAHKSDGIQFTYKQLVLKISQINPKKAPGPDNLPGQALKSLPREGLRGILFLFNAIMRLNHFPPKWKSSKIILIPKPGKNPTLTSSYRPISLLAALSKIFERLLLDELIADEAQLQLIPDHQFGFRQQHSTVEQVHKIVNSIKEALECKKTCVGIFLDVAQAFDKVNHNGLLKKIYTHLPMRYHGILSSYLSNRTFQAEYNQQISTSRSITAGVPQGSVLGPYLYLVFTMDLPTDNKILTATFADDTAILCAHQDTTVTRQRLQDHINKVSEWCKTWGIRLNESKSTQVTFTLKRETCDPIKLNGKNIPLRDSTKYLGIHLDRRLTWKKHILAKKEQITLTERKLRWLLQKKSRLSLETKLVIYKTIIRPIWTYGVQLWGSAKPSNLKIIDRCQTKILRSILAAPKFVRNTIILRDTNIASVVEATRTYSTGYKYRLASHPNVSARRILTATRYRRLQRTDPLSLDETAA